MKKLLLLSAILILISGCSNGLQILKKFEKYAKEHCPETKIEDPSSGKLISHFDCGNLWNSAPLDNYCSQMVFCIDATKGGHIWADIVCDSLIKPGDYWKAAKP